MDSKELVDEVINLVRENVELKDRLSQSVNAGKFYNCPLSTEMVALLHGVSPYVVRKYISLGLIETHPNSSDGKILVRGSTALTLNFEDMKRRAKFLTPGVGKRKP